MTKVATASKRDAPIEAERAKVLVVDDDERNLMVLETVLGEVADVVRARSGKEALRHLLSSDFAVILLDIFMPDMDGYDVAHTIRQRQQSKHIPIIFLTAVNKEDSQMRRGYEMGAVDYVFKPFEPVVLRSKVAVFVELYRKTREIQLKAEQEQRLLDENLRANEEKLAAERALRRSEERQALILRSLPFLLYLEPLDASPRAPQFVSGDFAGITGFGFERVQEDPALWMERLHPEDRDRVLAARADVAQTGAMSLEYRWQCADGSYKHFLEQAVVLPGEKGAPTEIAGTLLDVSERRQLESQLVQVQKMDAIGQLTGGIAHDFNNLLAGILAGLELLERRGSLDERSSKFVSMARQAAESGAELVSRMLAFSRRQQLRPSVISMDKLPASINDLMAHTLGGLVKVEWHVAADAWPAYADKGQLELALINLAINARDAMPDGGVIRIDSKNERLKRDNSLGLKPGDYVVIAVADSGRGIDPAIVDRVMEPFFTTKETGKGTGLGLSMVYGFAQQSGGGLRIESEVGRGARVEIWLPRAEKAAAELPVVRRQATENGSTQPKSGRILLVDDHESAREATAEVLKDHGYAVTTATSGAQALALLENDPQACDLIITDYAMPMLSGLEVVRIARSYRADLPAMIITGYADTAKIDSRPADVPLMNKPFDNRSFCEAVDMLLAGVR
jgi:signal transduction histidine kinase